MKTVRICGVLSLDEWKVKDLESKEWLFKLLLKEDLILHSNELGDEVGIFRIKLIEEYT